MTRFPTLIALVAALPLVAACGSAASAGTPSSGAPPVSAPHRVVAASELVAHMSDLGLGYIAVPTQTGPISRAEELKGDGPAARKADLAGYRSGYRALYADSDKDGVLTSAWEYSKDGYATTVISDRHAIATAAKEIHGTIHAAPSGAPGTHGVLLVGKLTEAGAKVPAYAYAWQHGSTLNLLLYFGVHATPSRLIKIAASQDRRETTAGV